LEVLGSYRENVVKNRREYYVKEIGGLRQKLANVQAELSFIPYISKYVIETAVIIGAVLIGGIQFLLNDASRAVATLAIFLAAGTRIAPAVLRVQQGAILIKGNLAVATPTLDLIEELSTLQTSSRKDSNFERIHKGFEPRVELKKVNFKYPGATSRALDSVDLKINQGELVVLVGSSGAGKTTLVDVILGIIESDSGEVSISGAKPLEAILQWPGAMAYVPQDVVIVNSTIRENITMGYEFGEAPEEAIWEALRLAQLDEFVNSLPEGVNSHVGDRGTKLSGGQRQRLGIARALLTKPKLLVLDEATSSLDGETEANISQALSSLQGEVTIILIAHRLSSVRTAEKVIYLNEGKIMCEGSFEFVRNSVPNFDKQAKLMGL
jgi:ABC-type multidrug transport system fused ATPase/permease subunit